MQRSAVFMGIVGICFFGVAGRFCSADEIEVTAENVPESTAAGDETAASGTEWKQKFFSDREAIRQQRETMKESAQAAIEEERNLMQEVVAAESSGDFEKAKELRGQLRTKHQANIEQRHENIRTLQDSRQAAREDLKSARQEGVFPPGMMGNASEHRPFGAAGVNPQGFNPPGNLPGHNPPGVGDRPLPPGWRDRAEDVLDRREDVRDRREDFRDRREDVQDRREDVRDRREDIRDKRHDGGRLDRLEDIADRREDVRDKREDVRDRREDVRDRREDRFDRREDKRDWRRPPQQNPGMGRPPGEGLGEHRSLQGGPGPGVRDHGRGIGAGKGQGGLHRAGGPGPHGGTDRPGGFNRSGASHRGAAGAHAGAGPRAAGGRRR